MADPGKPPKQLMKLVFFGLDHGIESIKNGGPLITFAATKTKQKKTLQRFLTKKIEEGKVEAEKYIRKLKSSPENAVIVYDGYITIEGKKYDAIFAEGFNHAQEKGYIFIQRYIPRTFLRRLKIIGNAAFVDDRSNLLME